MPQFCKRHHVLPRSDFALLRSFALLGSLWLLISCLASECSFAQSDLKAAYEQIKDKPGLPRVLLLGDSISIAYTLQVRQLLSEDANVHRPPMNCASTRTGLAKLAEWLGSEPWDVIHFNFGLHDQKHVVGESETLVAVTTPDSHRQVPLEEYEKNLTEIVAQLKRSGAKLIWCSTTPVPAGAQGRVPEDTQLYNAVALRIMKAHDVEVNDLNAFAASKLVEIQQPNNVHFTEQGSKALAEHVAGEIKKRLSQSEPASSK